MTISIKELEKAKKIFEQLQEIDAEIIQIEKMAALIVNKRSKITLQINVEDLEKIKEEDKVKMDEDGSLLQFPSFTYDPYLGALSRVTKELYGQSSKPNNPDISLTKELSETTILPILQLILRGKIEERKTLLTELNKLGINI